MSHGSFFSFSAKYAESDGLSVKWILSIVGMSIAATLILIVSVLYLLKKRKGKGMLLNYFNFIYHLLF